MMPRPAGAAACMALALAVACGGEPGPGGAAVVVVPIRQAAATVASAAIDSVAVRFERTDTLGGTVGQTGRALPEGTDSLSLRLPLTLLEDTETLTLLVALLGDGAEVFRTRTPVSVRRGAETVTPEILPATWERAGSGSGPGPRQFAAGASAPPLGGLVLIGGLTESGNDPATWVLADGTWTDLELGPADRPEARHGHAVAYDEERNRIVLFGGRVIGVQPFQDTWLFDGARWERVTPSDPPAGRTSHAMAYDAARGEVVLFGGTGAGGSLGDTWIWDGTTWRFAVSNQGPVARSGHTLTWDPERRRVVLVGGSNADGARADLWEWTGSRWEPRVPDNPPPVRREHAAGWDAARGRLVIFGGQVDGVPRGDVWELAGERWLPVEHAEAPRDRYGAVMLGEPSGGLLLFGGRRSSGFLADLWRYR